MNKLEQVDTTGNYGPERQQTPPSVSPDDVEAVLGATDLEAADHIVRLKQRITELLGEEEFREIDY